jgi:hypothetical protein
MTEAAKNRTVITVVHSPACHFCEDAQQALTDLATRYPLIVELVEAAHPRGRVLVAQHRAPMFPLVLIDDALFSFGRLPRNKLIKLLDRRQRRVVA